MVLHVIEQYEKPAVEWLAKQGWKENPFTLRILPSAFVGYNEQLKQLSRHIREGHKFAMVMGATGSGKTTLLQLFREELSHEYDVIFLPKPPTAEQLLDVMLEHYPQRLLQRLLGKRVNIHGLADYVNVRVKRKILLLVDEGHEADVKDLEWLRTVTDQIDRMQLVIAGLPILDEKLRQNLETFRSRVTTKVELVALSESETLDLVKRRLERHGGSGIKPFTEDVIKEVYRRSGGFPREILKQCDMLVENAMDKNLDTIDRMNGKPVPANVRVVTAEPPKTALTKDFMRDLPFKQRRLVEALAQADNMYPSEIAEKLGFDKYKSKQHAVRSMNNILQRLAEEGMVEREARGKGFVYKLVPSVKTMLVHG